MRAYVQWTSTEPQDWIAIDIAPGANEWRDLPKKPVPDGSEVLDDQPGWTFDVNVQGVHLYGFDHIALEPLLLPIGGIRAYVWSDDVDDDDPQQAPYQWGEVWEFYNPAPDPAFGGQINTRQNKTIYTEQFDPAFERQATSLGEVGVRSWSEWPAPDEELVRHGVWVRDEALWRQHFEARSAHGWREWL